ncbi:hypothetical protein [Methanolacinia paynteri]|uniref:hypothetical protein n=1 Tax=Methanolacinia paynteri TaxID=230356 RepID=UPI00064FB3F6|nr:hypothetical protein [Methanolacinia paynteri]
MEQKKVILALGLAAVFIVVISLSAVIFSGGSGQSFVEENPKNAELICDIIGYTNAVEARFNTSEPVPEYITEKYGTIYIPPDVMTCDLVEIHDLGLKRDNSTTLRTRIYDTVYDLNYIFIESSVLENGLGVDSYSSIIHYINDSESAGAGLFEFSDDAGGGSGLYRQEIFFQSQSGEGFGIHVSPAQERASAMNSTKPLYIVYSTKDIDHDYRIPLPEL